VPTVPLTTEEIASRSEHAVAHVRGKDGGGTGLLVDRGLLATNAHVVLDERIEDLHVGFPAAPGRPLTAQLLFEDPVRDLALLAVSTDLAPLEIEPAYRFRRGQEVTVIGNPGITTQFVLENAVSQGVMSTKTTITGQDYFQLSISINEGNSGGPVIDPLGKVIGVVTLKATQKEGIAFCIPARDLPSAIALAKQDGPGASAAVLVHRARYVAIRLDAAGEIYGRFLDASIKFMDMATARRLNHNSIMEKFRQDVTPLLDATDVLLRDEVKPEMDHVADDNRVSAAIRDDLINDWSVCQMMQDSIKRPTGTTETYRADAATLRNRHRQVAERLRSALHLRGS
jgi:hypothetical protein